MRTRNGLFVNVKLSILSKATAYKIESSSGFIHVNSNFAIYTHGYNTACTHSSKAYKYQLMIPTRSDHIIVKQQEYSDL